MFIQVHLVQSKSLSPFLMHRYLLCTLWILYDNAFAILLLFSLTSNNSFLFSWRHFFFLQRIKWWLELVPSCWQRRPAQQHWQEVQGWRSFHTWRWSNTEPRVGFWCKEVMLAEEMHFSIKLEIVVLLPPFFALFAIKMSTTPWFLSRPEKEKHLYFGHFKENMNLSFSLLVPRWFFRYVGTKTFAFSRKN